MSNTFSRDEKNFLGAFAPLENWFPLYRAKTPRKLGPTLVGAQSPKNFSRGAKPTLKIVLFQQEFST